MDDSLADGVSVARVVSMANRDQLFKVCAPAPHPPAPHPPAPHPPAPHPPVLYPPQLYANELYANDLMCVCLVGRARCST